MIIGVDVDGVLTKLEKYQISEGEKYFNRPPVNTAGYKVYEIFGLAKEDDKRFWRDNIFSYATYDSVQEGSDKVLKKLKEDGHIIYIVTARTYTRENTQRGEKMRTVLINWLKDNGIVYDKIIFSEEDKTEICKQLKLDVMVEDCVSNIENISKNIPVICVDAAYNHSLCGKNIYRAVGWEEVYKTITEIADSIK